MNRKKKIMLYINFKKILAIVKIVKLNSFADEKVVRDICFYNRQISSFAFIRYFQEKIFLFIIRENSSSSKSTKEAIPHAPEVHLFSSLNIFYMHVDLHVMLKFSRVMIQANSSMKVSENNAEEHVISVKEARGESSSDEMYLFPFLCSF